MSKKNNKDRVKDIDLLKVDDSVLDEDDVVSAASELDGIASEFFLFGCALGIARGMMKQLQDNYRHNQRQGLQAVLDEYVLGNHDTDKFGHPTWRNIIAAVSNPMGGNNHRLAKKIAANHGLGTSKKVPSTEESSRSFVDVTMKRNQEEVARSLHDPQRRCSAPPTPAAPPCNHPHDHSHHSTAPTPLQQNVYQNLPLYTDSQPHHTPVPSNFQRPPQQRYYPNPSDRKNVQRRCLAPINEPAGSIENPPTSWHDHSHDPQPHPQYDHQAQQRDPCYTHYQKMATRVPPQPNLGTQPPVPHASSHRQHGRMQDDYQQPHQGESRSHQGKKTPRTEMITGYSTRLHNMDLAGVPNQQPSTMAGAYYSPQLTRSEGFTQNQSKPTIAASQQLSQTFTTVENYQENIPGGRSRIVGLNTPRNMDIPDSVTTESTPDQSPPSSRRVWGPLSSQRSPNVEHQQSTSTPNTQGTVPLASRGPTNRETEVTPIRGAAYEPRRDQQYEQSHDDPAVFHIASKMSELSVGIPNTPKTAIPQTINQQKFIQADKRHEILNEQQQDAFFGQRGANVLEQQRGQRQLKSGTPPQNHNQQPKVPQDPNQQPLSRDNESLATAINSSLGTQTSVGSSTLSEYSSFDDDVSTSSVSGFKSSIFGNPSNTVPFPSPNLPVMGAEHGHLGARENRDVFSLTKYQQDGYDDETTSATTAQSSLSTYASEFQGNLSPPTDNPPREHVHVDDRYRATHGKYSSAPVYPPNASGDVLPAIPGESPPNIIRNPHLNTSMTDTEWSDQSMDRDCERLPILTEANRRVIPEDTNEYVATKPPAVASASSEEGYTSFAIHQTQGGMYKAENGPPVTYHKTVDRLENNSLVLPNKPEDLRILPSTIQGSPKQSTARQQPPHASPPQNIMASASPIKHDLKKDLKENMPQLIPAANIEEPEQCTSMRSSVTEAPEQVPFSQEHYSPNQIGGSSAIVQSTPSLTTNQCSPESLEDSQDQQEVQQTQFPVEPSSTHHQETQDAQPLSYSEHVQKTVRTMADGEKLHFDCCGACVRGEVKHKSVRLSFGLVSPLLGENPMSIHEEKYSMEKQPHGLAVIINNENFKKHDTRKGTKLDERNLTMTFRYLGFNVEAYHDLTKAQMCTLFANIQERDHSNYDSFVCCILTHGDNGNLIGSDSQPVDISELTQYLRARNCPGLRGKPKMFFIQACRGPTQCFMVATDGGNDNSVDVEREDIDCDGPSGQNPEGSILGKIILRSFPEIPQNEQIKADGVIPDVADFIFGYATPPGHVAYRDLQHGSWYISELCKALCMYSSVLSLEAIMTKVRCKVGIDYSHSYFKQAPETTTRLRAQVFF